MNNEVDFNKEPYKSRNKKRKLETLKNPLDKRKIEAFTSIRLRMLGRQDSDLRITGPKPVALPLGYDPSVWYFFKYFIFFQGDH